MSEDRLVDIFTSCFDGAVDELGQPTGLAMQGGILFEEYREASVVPHTVVHREPYAPVYSPALLWSINYTQAFYGQDDHLGMSHFGGYNAAQYPSDSTLEYGNTELALRPDPAHFSGHDVVQYPSNSTLEYGNAGPVLGPAEVPQKRYVARNRYNRLKAVRYVVDGRDGISLADAREGNFTGLENWASHAYPELDSKKLSLIINWPGYDGYSKQRNFHNGKRKNPTTVAELAKMFAEEMERLLKKYAKTPGEEPRWTLDSESKTINLKDIYLTEVQRVSHAGLQAKFVVLIQ